MQKTLLITSKDVKKSDEYWSDYIGSENVANFDGHIEIEANLGWVRFTGISATGHIIAKAGSGIEAGDGIKAGWGIEAGLSITCELNLKITYRIFAGLSIWKREVTDEEKTITCGQLVSGRVEYGILKETKNNL